ncbi:LytTR family DNA-binding domain-containing protein [Marinilabilia salmonicolor]|jgi:two-component system LytT family response regulator|uniref:LytTR family two component transcriptional regulator n=1 Tax=Marinilabilia salmonicolor TaxID=989 RepID=A0A368V8J7_9BACT|nr:LytTR family DNA-binding domain-containing protein [Marinilabilia salmonicolor]RCW37449.1 LytTR family two component transcriptional regulator [Marinilabilia salmonicolor]
MKAVIIDDEKNARNTVTSMLTMVANDIEVVAQANGVETGLKTIEQHVPDLVFLDIHMKDGTGFDLLRRLPNYHFALVFLTAHDNYALEAFRFAAIDYLLKPVDPDELEKTIERVRQQKPDNQKVMEVLLENMQKTSSSPRKIALKTSDAIHLIYSDEIIHCESADNYTRFFLNNQKPLLVSQSMKSTEEMLTPLGFLRVHQSHLINLSQISKIDRKNGYHVEMTDGTEVPVAVRKKDMLMKRLEEL